MPQSEKQFQAQVTALAKLCGWKVYHTFDARRSAAGFPDLCLVHPRRGLLVFAELKVGGGRPTAEQRAWLDALRAAGATAEVWTPANWDRVEATLTDS